MQALKNGLPWSKADVEELRRLVAAGRTRIEIAAEMERTVQGIVDKARSLGLVLPSKRRRSPLGAAADMNSEAARQPAAH